MMPETYAGEGRRSGQRNALLILWLVVFAMPTIVLVPMSARPLPADVFAACIAC